MVELWFAVVLVVLLGLYYWGKRTVWTTNRMYTDNQILQEFKLNGDAYLVEILHESGADVFELKDVSELSWKEGNRYFSDIERLFDNIQSHFKSGCARLLIEHRHSNVGYILKVEKLCKNLECKTCKLRDMKKDLQRWNHLQE